MMALMLFSVLSLKPTITSVSGSVALGGVIPL
jgi:hypothetical protein